MTREKGTNLPETLMCLFNRLILDKKDIYYLPPSDNECKLECFERVNFETIKSLFGSQGKGPFFDNEKEIEKFFTNKKKWSGRCKHVFSTYLLGIICYKTIKTVSSAFNKYMSDNIYPNTRDHEKYIDEHSDCRIPEDEVDYRNFLYLWYPTALYHDFGYYYEKPEDDEPQQKDITFSDLISIIKNKTLMGNDCFGSISDSLLYPKELKRAASLYFKNRFTNTDFAKNPCIDHGFAGGIKLLQKMHDIQYSKSPDEKIPNYVGKFWYSQKFYQWYNAASAWAITCHNIYLGQKRSEKDVIDIYDNGGLGNLTYIKNKSLIKFENNPLLFLLDFIDTIDPVKRFGVNSLNCFEIVESPENTFKLHVAGCNGGECLFANTILNKIDEDLDFLKSETFRVEVDGKKSSITFIFG